MDARPPHDNGALSRRALLLGGVGVAALATVGTGLAVEWDSPTLMRLRGACGGTPPLPHSDYRVTSGETRSTALGTNVGWDVALPPDHKPGDGTPVVICLPGLGSTSHSVIAGVGIPAYASDLGLRLAIAAPGGGGHDYWHPRAAGRDPMAWAVDEFLPMVEDRFGVGGSRDRRATLGWSMGGFGALLLAQQHPETFAAAVGMSPAVFPSYDAARSGHDYTFDSADDWQRYGLWTHLDVLVGTAVRIDCGDADPFAPTARQLLQRIPGVTGHIGSGCHDTAFWRRYAPVELRFLDRVLAG